MALYVYFFLWNKNAYLDTFWTRLATGDMNLGSFAFCVYAKQHLRVRQQHPHKLYLLHTRIYSI